MDHIDSMIVIVAETTCIISFSYIAIVLVFLIGIHNEQDVIGLTVGWDRHRTLSTYIHEFQMRDV